MHTRALKLQAAVDLLLAELSKIHSAVTVGQTVSCNMHAALQSTSITKTTSAEYLGSCSIESGVKSSCSRNFMQVNESMDITRARNEGEPAVTAGTAKLRLSDQNPFLEPQADSGLAMSPAVAMALLQSAAGYSVGAMTLDRLPAHNSVVGDLRADEEMLREAVVFAEELEQSVSDCEPPVQTPE